MSKLFGGALLASVLLVGLLAMPVLAATPGENLDRAKADYLAQQENYKKARQVFLDARADYLTAKKQWQKFKNNQDELTDKAKTQIGKGLDLSVEYLNGVNKLLVWSSNWYSGALTHKTTIDGYIAKLEGYRTDLASATTKAQIFDVSAKVRAEWNSIRADVKRITGDILLAKVQLSFDQADKALAKVDEVIGKRATANADVTELSALRAEAQAKYDLAWADYQQAKTTYSGISNVVEGNAMYNKVHVYLGNVNKYLTGVYKDLKAIQREMKTPGAGAQSGGVEGGIVVGPKSKNLEGTGYVRMTGTGTVTLTGKPTRFEASSDAYATVTITGGATFDASDFGGEASKTVNDDGSVVYEGRGTLKLESITGGDVTIVVDGTALNVFAQGIGTVDMAGTGTYEKGKCPTDSPASCVVIVSNAVSGTESFKVE